MEKYDLKIFAENGEEKETIRDLNYSQMYAISSALRRLKVKHRVIKLDEDGEGGTINGWVDFWNEQEVVKK